MPNTHLSCSRYISCNSNIYGKPGFERTERDLVQVIILCQGKYKKLTSFVNSNRLHSSRSLRNRIPAKNCPVTLGAPTKFELFGIVLNSAYVSRSWIPYARLCFAPQISCVLNRARLDYVSLLTGISRRVERFVDRYRKIEDMMQRPKVIIY